MTDRRSLSLPALRCTTVGSGPPFVTPKGLSQICVLGHRPLVSPGGGAGLQGAVTDHETRRHDLR